MNIIDICAIVPFYLSLLLEGLEDFEIIGKTGKMIRLVRVMRILRIFKLVRHFAGLQSLFYTLQQAYQELGLLLVIIAVAILTYSSLVYFAEKEVPDGVNCSDWNSGGSEDHQDMDINHPCYVWTFVESFWWCLMTITTVGYELSPKSFLGKTSSHLTPLTSEISPGKLIGGCCALSGVFILTLPIPIGSSSINKQTSLCRLAKIDLDKSLLI